MSKANPYNVFTKEKLNEGTTGSERPSETIFRKSRTSYKYIKYKLIKIHEQS